MTRTASIVLSAALLSAAPAIIIADHHDDADEPQPLSIGSIAPALDIAHWLKGEPVSEFEDGKVYVVEFWATWCGPCVAAMPHVTELQQKFEEYNVRIIGVSDEKLQTVVGFLARKDGEGKTWHEKLAHSMATDPDRSTHTAYMQAAGQRGIPTAFIVGKTGHIEWIGHPMGMDDPLHQVVHDKWDRDAYAQEFNRQQEEDRRMAEAMGAVQKAMMEENWEEWQRLMDELIEEMPTNSFLKLQRYMVLLTVKKDVEKANAYGGDLVKEVWDNAMFLNHIAWTIVDDEDVPEGGRDLDLAMRAANRANELTNEKDAAILDTVARVHYEKGDLAEAIKWQRKAAEHAGEGRMADDIRETLEKYEEESKAKAGR